MRTVLVMELRELLGGMWLGGFGQRRPLEATDAVWPVRGKGRETFDGGNRTPTRFYKARVYIINKWEKGKQVRRFWSVCSSRRRKRDARDVTSCPFSGSPAAPAGPAPAAPAADERSWTAAVSSAARALPPAPPRRRCSSAKPT